MKGYELASRLRYERPELKILYLSGSPKESSTAPTVSGPGTTTNVDLRSTLGASGRKRKRAPPLQRRRSQRDWKREFELAPAYLSQPTVAPLSAAAVRRSMERITRSTTGRHALKRAHAPDAGRSAGRASPFRQNRSMLLANCINSLRRSYGNVNQLASPSRFLLIG